MFLCGSPWFAAFPAGPPSASPLLRFPAPFTMMDCTEDLSLDLALGDAALGVVGDQLATCGMAPPAGALFCAPAPPPLSFPSASCPGGSPMGRASSPRTPDLDLLLSQLSAMLATFASGRTAVSPTYITTIHRGYLLPAWRRQIVEWIFDVAEEFGLSSTCAFAAIQLLDRFLSRQQVRHSELQMLGLACIIIASKLHESQPLRMVRVAVWHVLVRSVCVSRACRRDGAPPIVSCACGCWPLPRTVAHWRPSRECVAPPRWRECGCGLACWLSGVCARQILSSAPASFSFSACCCAM